MFFKNFVQDNGQDISCIYISIYCLEIQITYDNFFSEEHVDGEENTKKNKESVRQKWTADEVDELKRLFHLNIEKLKCPNTKDIIKAKKISENENGFIHLRKLENIKKKMSNMIIKIKHTK